MQVIMNFRIFEVFFLGILSWKGASLFSGKLGERELFPNWRTGSGYHMGGISFDRKGGRGVQNNHRAGERGRGAPHYGKPWERIFSKFFQRPKNSKTNNRHN